ncbi:hypothetical protein FNL56_20180 [Tardiphaga sp. vice304]|uniref:hypothetical protein n=1 Tax=Tardiphaga sp. vice304 TaxID=2592817 RepID=UPI001163D48E|nr:hypothetical protein [Tardiphaga sp. vice304]QDM28188.1 hypothetical protein FNL56_20180 [Tardiphaga sp. vice304]
MSIDVVEVKPSLQTERLWRWLAIGSLGLIVFGAKILFIRYFGSAVPYWDQWDAEADILYKAYLNSNLSWSALFAPHNEHRILLTRLLSLLLFELDGGWDPILQMMVNAGLHVVAIVLIVLALQRILGPGQLVSLVAFSAVLFLLPIGWENLLAGFQSQFYLLLIFTILALSGLAVAPAFGARWWISVAYAIAAFFSMASGALIGAAALGIVVLQMLLRVRLGRKEYAGAAVLLVMSMVMIAFVPKVAGHDGLKAHSIGELIRALLACLDYPRSGSFAGILTNLPLLAYAYYVLKTRPPRTSPHWIVLSIIVWWFGQILSLSYGRAVAPTSSRYLDIVIVALPVNFAIILFAARTVSVDRQHGLFVATAAWLVLILPGLVLNSASSGFPSVFEKAAQSSEQQASVVEYIRTGSMAVLQNKPFLAIPYPSPDRLASLLSDPTIRMALPRLIRPTDVSDSAMLDRTLLKGRFRAWIERVKAVVLSLASLMLGLGLALAFMATFQKSHCRT